MVTGESIWPTSRLEHFTATESDRPERGASVTTCEATAVSLACAAPGAHASVTASAAVPTAAVTFSPIFRRACHRRGRPEKYTGYP